MPGPFSAGLSWWRWRQQQHPALRAADTAEKGPCSAPSAPAPPLQSQLQPSSQAPAAPPHHYLVPKLGGLGSSCTSHGLNQVADLLDSRDHLVMQGLARGGGEGVS